jgi:hypothetical protein
VRAGGTKDILFGQRIRIADSSAQSGAWHASLWGLGPLGRWAVCPLSMSVSGPVDLRSTSLIRAGLSLVGLSLLSCPAAQGTASLSEPLQALRRASRGWERAFICRRRQSAYFHFCPVRSNQYTVLLLCARNGRSWQDPLFLRQSSWRVWQPGSLEPGRNGPETSPTAAHPGESEPTQRRPSWWWNASPKSKFSKPAISYRLSSIAPIPALAFPVRPEKAR